MEAFWCGWARTRTTWQLGEVMALLSEMPEPVGLAAAMDVSVYRRG